MNEGKHISLNLYDLGKNLWRNGRMAMLAMAALPLYSLLNVFWLSKFGVEAMAGTAIFFPWLLLMAAVALIWGMGSSILLQQAHSRQDVPAMSGIAAAAVKGGALVLLGLFAAGEAGLLHILPWLGAVPATMSLAMDYGRVFLAGALLHGMNALGQNLLAGSGRMEAATRLMTAVLLLGMLLSPLAIFGAGLGVMGAAWAFLGTELLGSVLFTWQLAKADLLHWQNNGDFTVLARQILSFGWHPFALQFMGALILAVTNCVVSWYGMIPVAAVSVVMRHVALVTMLTMGFSKGYARLHAYCLQKCGREQAEKLTHKSMLLLSAAVVLLGSLIMLASPQIIRAFIDIPQAVAFASAGMKMVFASVLLAGMDSIISHRFQQMGKDLFWPRLLQGVLYFPLMPLFLSYGGILGIPAAIMVTKMAGSLGGIYLWKRS